MGTLCAIQIPVVGLAPLKSMEQVGPMLVFVGMQFMLITEKVAAAKGLTSFRDVLRFRFRTAATVGAVAAAVIAVLVPSGFFGPLSIRVRSLFIPHTRTGNPLVDSVAEHQPATPDAYYQFLHNANQVCQRAILDLGFLDGVLDDPVVMLSTCAQIRSNFSLRCVS